MDKRDYNTTDIMSRINTEGHLIVDRFREACYQYLCGGSTLSRRTMLPSMIWKTSP